MKRHTKDIESMYRPAWKWLGRSLSNYKRINAPAAKARDKYEDFMEAETLTEARKLAYGAKKGATK